MKLLKDHIVELTNPLFRDMNYELVDLAMKGKSKSRIFQFIADRDGGVTIDDCVMLSRRISDLLEVHQDDLELVDYRIEVSSPGIDHPLRNEKDFRRQLNRRIDMTCRQSGKIRTFVGDVVQVNPEMVTLKTNNETVNFRYTDIVRAKIKLKW